MAGSRTNRGPHICLVVTALILLGGLGCKGHRAKLGQAQYMTGKTIQQVQEKHTGVWMAIPGVVGTAIGQCEGKPCVLVLTASNTEQLRKDIPVTFAGTDADYPLHVGDEDFAITNLFGTCIGQNSLHHLFKPHHFYNHQ